MDLADVIESLERSIPMIERHVDAQLSYVEGAVNAATSALDALDRLMPVTGCA